MSEDAIRNILSSIQDDNDNPSLAEDGRIRHIEVSEERIYVLLSIPQDAHARFAPLREKAESLLKDAYPQKNILVGMTAVKESMKEGMKEDTPPQKTPSFPARHIIAIGSGKGGVGKSTVALNLAVTLAHHHKMSVGILDTDVHGPSIPHLMNCHEPPTIIDKKIVPFQKWNVHAMSLGMLVKPSEPAVLRGPMMGRAVEQMIDDVAWPSLDVLIIDFPPGTGDVHLSTARKLSISGAVIVSTPQDLALLDAKKMIGMCQKLSLPILGCIENMSGFVCPHCQKETPIFGKYGLQECAKKLNIPYLGAIPLQIDIRTASDSGHTIIIDNDTHPFTLAMTRISDALVASLAVLS